MARNESDTFERHSARLEPVGDGTEGATGQTGSFVDDDVVHLRRDDLGRQFDLPRERISEGAGRLREGRIQSCRHDCAERRPDASNADHPGGTGQAQLARGVDIRFGVHGVECKAFRQPKLDAPMDIELRRHRQITDPRKAAVP